MNYVHSPIFVQQILEKLILGEDRFFLDCTTGEGGHSEAILNTFKDIVVHGIDRDEKILKIAGQRLSRFGNRFIGHNLNFTDVPTLHNDHNELHFDAALIDLGISVFHYKKSGRGFSFREHEPLDMRLDGTGTSVFDIVNTYPEKELVTLFFTYGEERFSRLIARKIVQSRETKDIEYTDELARIIASAVPARFKGKKTHPATKVFQALRIESNNELENIKAGIPAVLSLLKPGGRLGVITFHSIEDRIVKKLFAYMNKECICPPELPVCCCDKKREVKLLTKALKPSEQEVADNPSARSAKLRIVEKL